MIRPACLVPILAAWVFSLAGTAQAGEAKRVWSFGNHFLDVRVDARTGAVSVLDKRAGHRWDAVVPEPPAAPTLNVPQAVRPIAVDGRLDDWGRAAVVRITPRMTADARRVDGPKDLSAVLRLCWRGAALYFAVEVNDETLRFARPDERQWWHWDSVEFWLGGTQCAWRLAGARPTLWSASRVTKGAQAALARRPGGYVLEAMVPVGARRGKRMRFALGVNDCDAKPGEREGQIYYPRTWRHSRPSTFATLVFADPQGRAPAAKKAGVEDAFTRVQPLRGGRAGVRCVAACPTDRGGTVRAQLTLWAPKDAADLVVDIDLPDRAAKITRFRVLPALPLFDANAAILWPCYNDGLAVPVTERSWRGRRALLGSLDQPWVGLTDGKQGYLIIGDTPDDLEVRLDSVTRAGARRLVPTAWVRDSKQTFRYPRRFRYAFTARGGLVGVAKRFRRYAAERGMLKTQKEKLKRKPALARLPGAPDIWGATSLQFAREAITAGVDRAIINGATRPEDMREIVRLGWLISKYDNYEDCMAGRNNHYGDVKIPDDCPLLANGKRMRGWLTFDKKKQFMKRCSVKQLAVARRWIPKDLAKYPYNARFLDVTTATGLRECYDPNHPCTREQDRLAKRALAKYVGDELGLVLGGEHGRWWGADIYNYWEGMQSGGFYSWPAGHVGKNLPKTRQDIGKRYLEWGLGHRVRVPLWELVFGDCVLSTWYWGDSTGHLYNVAPELAAKKDAFNILYGTVPLYWVNRPYGFNWSQPALRSRLLESYRNTCKLNEEIAFEEMTSFEYVTPDKDVQRTRFADGTVVTVNFGPKPFALKDGDQTYHLPQFGFHAKGPRIFQVKTLESGRPVTIIRKAGYFFGDAAGKWKDFGPAATDGRVTLRRRPQGLLINLERTRRGARVWTARFLGAGSGRYARLFRLNSIGEPTESLPLRREGDAIALRGDGAYLLLCGDAAAKPDFRIRPADLRLTPGLPRQGERLRVAARVRNAGRAARGVEAALFIDAVKPGARVAAARLDLPAAGLAEVVFVVDTTLYDGAHTLIAVVDPENKFPEFCETDNRVEAPVAIAADWTHWPHKLDLTVTTNAPVTDWPASARLDLARELKGRALDAASVRVAEATPNGWRPCVCQWESAGPSRGEAWWVMPGLTRPDKPRRFRMLFAPKGYAAFRAREGGWWRAKEKEVVTPFYRARFVDGAIRGMWLRYPGAPRDSFIRVIAASSGETKWSEPEGKVTRFEVLQAGPVRAVVRVGKDLPAGVHYEKTYEFYARHFVVTVDVNKPLIYSRAFYNGRCEYLDDKGHRAVVDGAGGGEGVAGRNPNPQWYQVIGEGWAQSCAALSAFGNISYWDPGAQIGFTHAKRLPCRVGYMMHAKPPTPAFGADDARALRVRLRVTVKREG